MKRKDIIEFEIGSMEFGGESSTLIGKRKVKMKGVLIMLTHALLAALAVFICYGGNWITGQTMIDVH